MENLPLTKYKGIMFGFHNEFEKVFSIELFLFFSKDSLPNEVSRGESSDESIILGAGYVVHPDPKDPFLESFVQELQVRDRYLFTYVGDMHQESRDYVASKRDTLSATALVPVEYCTITRKEFVNDRSDEDQIVKEQAEKDVEKLLVYLRDNYFAYQV